MSSIQQQISKWESESSDNRLVQEIRRENQQLNRTLVVLDDDPTGTQTVHDVPVVTSWDTDLVQDLLSEEIPLFYILTNSRSMKAGQAATLVQTIVSNLQAASEKIGCDYSVILRSDSTLRGHHPEEMDAALEISGQPDLKIFLPAFMEGGRITYEAVHYAKEGNKYIPCGETQYARDASFAYESSNLKQWIAEKTGKSVTADAVDHLSIEQIRYSTIEDITRKIAQVDRGNYLLADAFCYYDIDKFCLALLRSGRTFIARTAASFVASIGGIDKRPLLSPDELQYQSENGGLIVAGSHVDKTTRQITALIKESNIKHKVLDVKNMLNGDDRSSYLQEWIGVLNEHIKNSKDLLIYTSREVVRVDNVEENLDIANSISTFISDLIGSLQEFPSFLIAKGGITSSVIATESLNVNRAEVMGQVLPGIPVWKIGNESKYPGMPYIIFPGNVGDDTALFDAYKRIKDRRISYKGSQY